MKFVVDELPATCADCDFHAKAMVMSELGVQKEVSLCTIQMSLIPPKDPQQQPNFLNLEDTPANNNCPCTTNASKASSLIL